MSIRITPGTVKPKPYPWQVPSWVDWVVDHPSEIASALRGVGIDDVTTMTTDLDKALGVLVSKHPEDFAPWGDHGAPRPQARAAWIQVIKEFITGLKVVEEASTVVTKELPLCIFDSPRVARSRTTFAQIEVAEATAGWNIEVLGTGSGSDITISVTESSEFLSSNGERKLMFVPLQIRVSLAALYKRGDLQKKFLKAELFEPEVRDANGLRSVPEEEWRGLVRTGKLADRFDLSGDRSDDISKYSREYELAGNFELNIGIKALTLESKVTAKFTATQKVSMTFELPAGQVYELRKPASIAGFYFGS